MKHLRRYVLAALAALPLLFPAVGRAQGLTFTFTHPNPSGTSGSVIEYAGTVTNTSGATLYLTFDTLGALAPSAAGTGDDTLFFDAVTLPYLNSAPIALTNGASFTLPVFDVVLAPNASLGSVASGLFSVQADSSPDPNNPVQGFTTADVSFSATVVSAPEPVGWEVFALGGVSLLVGGIRSRKRTDLASGPRSMP